MPELPEVETMSRGLQGAVGKKIADITSDWPRLIKGLRAADIAKELKGGAIKSVFRRGKYLIFEIENKSGPSYLVFHPKMTGHPHLVESRPSDKHIHFSILFKDGSWLAFRDVRKFSRFYLFKNLSELEEALGLGPEPLDPGFSIDKFKAIIARSPRKRIKDLLLDQARIAGIGNIYADESLWASKIHPERRSTSLETIEIDALYSHIREILKEAIKRKGSSVRTYRTPSGASGSYANLLKAYGRTGLPCPRCGAKIERKKVGGRSSHFCPQCQKK